MKTYECLNNRLYLYVILLAINCLVNAQTVQRQSLSEQFGERTKFINYTTKNGLSQNAIYTILQDSRGYMWFGTQGGLSRFNGHEFTIYNHDAFDTTTIRHSYINKIYQDSKERIWVCTEAGLALFNPQNESFTNFVHDDENPKSISDNYVWTIFEDSDGTLWVGTEKGLSRFDAETKSFDNLDLSEFTNGKPTSLNIFSIFQDSKGLLWLCSRGKGLFTISKSNKQNNYDSKFIIKNFSVGNNDVRQIVEDSKGTLVAATFGTGLYKFNINENEFVKHNLNFGPYKLRRPEFVKTLFIDSSHSEILWLGTEEDGLILIDTEENELVNLNHNPKLPNSLSGNMVYSICKSRSGLIWIGSNQGINLLNLNTNRFRHYQSEKENTQSISSNIIGKFVEDKFGYLWVGTDGGGVNKIDRSTNKYIHYKHDSGNPLSLSSDRAMIIFEDNASDIWIGTYGGGLNKYNRSSDTFKIYRRNNSNASSLCSDYVTSIVQDKSGIIWIGTTTGGVTKFDPETEEFECFVHDPDKPQSLSDNHVWILFIDSKDVLWAGTRNGGLNKMIDKESGLFKNYSHNENVPTSISNNTIFDIYEDKNYNFWVATNSGLNKLMRESGEFKNFSGKVIPSHLGFAGILEDDKNQLWMLSGNSIIRFNPKSNEIKTYDNTNGMMVNDLRIWSLYKNKSGEMFFGGANGFTVFHPNSLMDNTYIPPIVIDKFERFNTDNKSGYAIPESGIAYKSSIELSYKDNIFSFSFAALNYINPLKNQYAYKLIGFNDDWINIGTKHSITFTNIDPGTYTFCIKGSNDDGVWNEAGASFIVNISPPYWKTWWFRIGGILLIILSISSFVLSKLRAIDRHHKEQEAFARQLIETEEFERQRIANELHDSLGQNLLVIKNSLLVKQQQDQIEGKSLGETSDLVSNTIQEVRSISHNLRPHLLDQLGLTKTIKSLAKQLKGTGGIDIIADVDDLKGALEPNAEINIFRILQESFNNIIKHSGATQVELFIKRYPDKLNIVIKDNGKGMNLEEVKKSENYGHGFGLYGMEKRAHVFNWSFKIDSIINTGTEIKITIPLERIA